MEAAPLSTPTTPPPPPQKQRRRAWTLPTGRISFAPSFAYGRRCFQLKWSEAARRGNWVEEYHESLEEQVLPYLLAHHVILYRDTLAYQQVSTLYLEVDARRRTENTIRQKLTRPRLQHEGHVTLFSLRYVSAIPAGLTQYQPEIEKGDHI